MKNKYYFTFGQNHTHRFNGVTLDCDSVLVIVAKSLLEARTKMFELFGCKWGMCYESDKIDFAHYPRGIALEIQA